MKRNGMVRLVIGILLVWGLLFSYPVRAEMARYDVDSEHSTVGFKVAHMMASKTTGHFTDYTGFIEMDPDKMEVKTIEATIQAASVTTNHKKRDDHLRGSDFFNVEKYPTITYKLKSYRKTGDSYAAIGDFTLLGVTKEITLVGISTVLRKTPGGICGQDSAQKGRSIAKTSVWSGTKSWTTAALSLVMRS